MKGRPNRGLVSEIWFQLGAISASIDEDFSHWDEWVGLDRLMKNTDENKKKNEYLNQKQGTDKNAKLIHTTHTKPKSYHGWVYHLLTFLLLLPNHEIWIYS
ncbi:unnamed protein product [Malus baccata var. baccata]